MEEVNQEHALLVVFVVQHISDKAVVVSVEDIAHYAHHVQLEQHSLVVQARVPQIIGNAIHVHLDPIIQEDTL